MTDRELLEAAARAANLPLADWSDGGDWFLILGPDADWRRSLFAPLTDDADALRLAVKLRIDVIHNEPQDNSAWVMAGDLSSVEDVDGEAYRLAATRRAIVRAAALGGEMKGC